MWSWLNSAGVPGTGSREALFHTASALEALHTHGSVPRGSGETAAESASSCPPFLHGKLYCSLHSPFLSSHVEQLPRHALLLLLCLSAHVLFPLLITLFHPCFLLLHLLISTSGSGLAQPPPSLGWLPRPDGAGAPLCSPGAQGYVEQSLTLSQGKSTYYRALPRDERPSPKQRLLFIPASHP